MPKLRRLSGAELIRNHGELDTGTARAILRQATRYIAEDDLRPYFYAE